MLIICLGEDFYKIRFLLRTNDFIISFRKLESCEKSKMILSTYHDIKIY